MSLNQPRQHVSATQTLRPVMWICLWELGMLEIVRKPREVTHTHEGKSTCKEKADTPVTRFFSAPVLNRLSLPWGRCSSFWRGHVWLLSALLLGKKKPPLPALSRIWSAFIRGGEATSALLGNEFCVMLRAEKQPVVRHQSRMEET